MSEEPIIEGEVALAVVAPRCSPEQGELTEALCKARGNFAKISKDAKGNHGKYAALETMLAATLPALNAEGVDLSFDTDYEGERRLKVCRVDHKSGQWRTHRLEMIVDPPRKSKQGYEINNNMQMVGIASSYAARYVLMDALAIRPDEEDSDRLPPQKRGQPPASRRPPSSGASDRATSGPRQSRVVSPPEQSGAPPVTQDDANAALAVPEKTVEWVRKHAVDGEAEKTIQGILKYAKDAPPKPSVSPPLRQGLYRSKTAGGWTSEEIKTQTLELFEIHLVDVPASCWELFRTFWVNIPRAALEAAEGAK